MVDLMNLLSDVLIGSFQMLMLNDLGKNMFPYRIKTCWTRILIYGVTALVILGVNHIESTFINIMMVPVSYTIASIVIFQGSVWKKIILTCCYYMLAIVPEFLFAVITGAWDYILYSMAHCYCCYIFIVSSRHWTQKIG